MGRLPQDAQTSPLCLAFGGGSVPCVENRRWTMRGVTYATMNIQGSCNNLCDTPPDRLEWAARNAAVIAWMRQTFAAAQSDGSAAVMLISQANPGWDESDSTRAPRRKPMTLAQTDGAADGFQAFLLALREEVVTFRRPVAYVHRDSHDFRMDNPLLDAQGRRLENFTRVETFGNNPGNGNNDVRWVKYSSTPEPAKCSHSTRRSFPATGPQSRRPDSDVTQNAAAGALACRHAGHGRGHGDGVLPL